MTKRDKIWLAFMVVGFAVSLAKPEMLRADAAFTGIAYALMTWVMAMIIADE